MTGLEESLVELQALGAWDILIAGADAPEERRTLLPGRLQAQTVIRMERSREEEPHVFNLSASDGNLCTAVSWDEIKTALTKLVPGGARRILVDITSLDLESLLYIFPALISLGAERVVCAYTVPDHYPQDETLDVQALGFQQIQQPKGYVSFPPSEPSERDLRVLILGFDAGRAKKFIQKYDWHDSEIRLIIGKPPCYPNGDTLVRKANESVINQISKAYPSSIIELPAGDPRHMREFLEVALAAHRRIDIIPLGPKPLLLGSLLFYFTREEQERARVRFLYDFPVSRSGRTSGQREVVFFDCNMLL